jgi:hypothetical protein
MDETTMLNLQRQVKKKMLKTKIHDILKNNHFPSDFLESIDSKLEKEGIFNLYHWSKVNHLDLGIPSVVKAILNDELDKFQ